MSRLTIDQLLDEFNIRDATSFHRLEFGLRPIFVSRLYKAIAAAYEPALREIRAASGLKLHFAGRAARGGMVANLPSQAFLKKVAFYSSRTLITFPFNEVRRPEHLRPRLPHRDRAHGTGHVWREEPRPMLFGHVVTRRTPAGGEVEAIGKAYTVDPADFDDFLSLLCQARPAIVAGVVTVLPVFSDTHQLVLRYRDGLLPAAFQLARLREQFDEQVLEPIARLYLPTCADLPFGTILGLRQKEREAFQSFQRHLEQLLYGIDAPKQEDKLLHHLEAIHHGIADLNRRFMDARKNLFMYEALPAAAGLTLLLSPLGGVAAIAALKTAIGSVVLNEFATPYLDYRKEVRDLRQDRCYLPWRISRARKRWFGGDPP